LFAAGDPDTLCAVPRSTRKRLVIVVVLFCQFVTTMFVHAPMVHAAGLQSEVSSAAEDQPCPGHQQAKQQDGAVHASHMGEQHGSSTNAGGCKSAFCNCACAHAPALAATVALGIPDAPAHDSPITYSAQSVPDSATTFFRPPI
jgi:hypothetical protein